MARKKLFRVTLTVETDARGSWQNARTKQYIKMAVTSIDVALAIAGLVFASDWFSMAIKGRPTVEEIKEPS